MTTKSRNLLALAVVALCCAGPASAAGLTAREITAKLYAASAGSPLDFSGADFSNLDLSGLDFKSAILRNANFYGADLTSANLAGTDLSGARLDRATLIGATFANARLENVTLLAPNIFSDVSFKAEETPKFSGASLRGARIAARIDGGDFRGADMTGARLGPSDRSAEAGMAPASKMLGCDFSNATLVDAEIRAVDLTFGRFISANLRGARLIDLDLTRADFSNADLTGADFSGSNLDGAILTGVKGFETVKGLDSVINLEKSLR